MKKIEYDLPVFNDPHVADSNEYYHLIVAYLSKLLIKA